MLRGLLPLARNAYVWPLVALSIIVLCAARAKAEEATAASGNASTAAAESPGSAPANESTADALTMVVMDPLALPLSCPCVKGYAQRKYDKLGEKLQSDLHRPVKVVFNESLTSALKGDAHGKADLVIGKHSVVLFDAERSGQKLRAIASLTGKDGSTTQTGLIVVPSSDPAHSVAELKGYHLIFGPQECDEKYAAAMTLLRNNGVEIPVVVETSPACSDGACQILDEVKKDSSKHGAALISSYAKPLLEGCGTVEKGALRVVGETTAVPFVEAFVSETLPDAEKTALVNALLKSTDDPMLRLALETQNGFVAIPVGQTMAGVRIENDASDAAKKK